MKTTKAKITHQLKIVRGQLDGVLRMIDDQEKCINVLTQLAAAEKGIKRATSLVLENHLQGCLTANSREQRELQPKLHELIEAFKKFI